VTTDTAGFAITAAAYDQGGRCPEEHRILLLDQCEEAAAALGVDWFPAADWSNDPPGCFKCNEPDCSFDAITFNTDASSVGIQPNRQAVCATCGLRDVCGVCSGDGSTCAGEGNILLLYS
jgi:hypothetical protein